MYRPAREGRSCEHFGGCKTMNRIPLYIRITMDYILVIVVIFTRFNPRANAIYCLEVSTYVRLVEKRHYHIPGILYYSMN